ncbi:hypothetical protein CYY_000001 [Polysphondylium violaceum]|uniref:MICOS complex subunit MIC10 n=1 Tax=Polysphondylium violaceum TaxID=133409 RepID=A0A8J4V2Q8_9MYCE|nr:hypothetical protein CYY_000001 [Polysphondylium violaceum]
MSEQKVITTEDQKLINTTEKCVEAILKKTTYGLVAPLGLLLVTSRLKVIGTAMLFGGGIGLGMGISDCNRYTRCHARSVCKKTDGKPCPKKQATAAVTEPVVEKADN